MIVFQHRHPKLTIQATKTNKHIARISSISIALQCEPEGNCTSLARGFSRACFGTFCCRSLDSPLRPAVDSFANSLRNTCRSTVGSWVLNINIYQLYCRFQCVERSFGETSKRIDKPRKISPWWRRTSTSEAPQEVSCRSHRFASFRHFLISFEAKKCVWGQGPRGDPRVLRCPILCENVWDILCCATTADSFGFQ